jgi:uncharacterized membrane protein YhhN
MITRILLVAYAVFSVANIACVAVGATWPTTLTKACLMPLLLAWLLVMMRRGSRVPSALRWLAVGVVFAWFGDLLLSGDGDGFFIAGIAAFLIMQVCYIVAFTRVPGPGLVRAWKVSLIPYVLVWLVLNILVSPGVGALRIPVIVYSVVLVAMAVAALDLVIRVPQDKGWRVAIGAALFVLSDALIALTAFGPLTESNGWSVLIMSTYLAAQAMIVTGFAECIAVRHSTDAN